MSSFCAYIFIFEDFAGHALDFANVFSRFVDGSAVGGVEWAAKAMVTRTNALARRQRRSAAGLCPTGQRGRLSPPGFLSWKVTCPESTDGCLRSP